MSRLEIRIEHLVHGSTQTTWRLQSAPPQSPMAQASSKLIVLTAVAYRPDGQAFAVGGHKGAIELWSWDGQAAECVGEFIGHTGAIQSLVWTLNDGTYELLSASEDGTLRIWRDGELSAVLQGHRGRVNAVDVTGDGTAIVSASDDRTVRLWNRISGTVEEWEGHSGWVNDVTFDESGQHVLSGGADANVIYWNRQTQRGTVWHGHVATVTSVTFLPGSQWAVTGAEDGTVKLWDVSRGTVVATYRDHEGILHDLKAYGELLATASSDQRVGLYCMRKTHKAPNGELNILLGWLQGHRRPVHALDWNPTLPQLLTAGADGTLAIWRPEQAKIGARRHAGSIRACAYSSCSSWLATGSRDESVWVRDASSGRRVVRLTGHSGAVQGLAFSPDDATLLSVATDGQARIWEIPTGKCTLELQAHSDPISTCAFSNDGSHFFTGCRDSTTRIWDTRTGQQVGVLNGHDHWVRCMAVHPDGQHLLTGSYDGSIIVWELQEFTAVCRYAGHTRPDGSPAPVTALGILADGQHAVSGGLDNQLHIWNLATGDTVLDFVAHDAGLVALVTTQTEIITASMDRTVRRWSQPEFSTPPALVHAVEFPVELDSLALCGTRLAVGDRAGELWRLLR